MARNPTQQPSAPAAAESVLDIREILERLKLPGLDVPKLLESSRKDVEALIKVNENAYRGIEALTRRQGEVLAQAMEEWRESAKDLVTGKTAAQNAARGIEQARSAFEKALGHMREMAEIVIESHEQTVAVLNRRAKESYDELKNQLTRNR